MSDVGVPLGMRLGFADRVESLGPRFRWYRIRKNTLFLASGESTCGCSPVFRDVITCCVISYPPIAQRFDLPSLLVCLAFFAPEMYRSE